eukprot:13184255-Ditylum_brightwellii.AAC.1
MDVQLQIKDTIANLKLQIFANHVHGHQDSTQKMKQLNTRISKRLSWQATLNILADQLATQACDTSYNKNIKENFEPLPAACAYLYINKRQITRNTRSTINTVWTTKDLREHLTQKFKWSSTTADYVGWYVCGSVHTNAQDPHFKQFIV